MLSRFGPSRRRYEKHDLVSQLASSYHDRLHCLRTWTRIFSKQKELDLTATDVGKITPSHHVWYNLHSINDLY